MMNKETRHLDFNHAQAEVSCFDNGTGVKELHAIIHVNSPQLPYAKQLEAILDASAALQRELREPRPFSSVIS